MNIAQMIEHRIAHYKRVPIMAQSHEAMRKLLRVEDGAEINASDVAWLIAGYTILDREQHGEKSDFGTEEPKELEP